jgi:hypothetical protein
MGFGSRACVWNKIRRTMACEVVKKEVQEKLEKRGKQCRIRAVTGRSRFRLHVAI